MQLVLNPPIDIRIPPLLSSPVVHGGSN